MTTHQPDKRAEALRKWKIANAVCKSSETDTPEKWEELEKGVMHILVVHGDDIVSALTPAQDAGRVDLAEVKKEIVPWISTRMPKMRKINRIEVSDWIDLFTDHLAATYPQHFKGE